MNTTFAEVVKQHIESLDDKVFSLQTAINEYCFKCVRSTPDKTMICGAECPLAGSNSL